MNHGQERVVERQRGVINGVELAICNSLDLVKFVLVMFLPHVETFGFLVMISLASVSLGWCFFLKFVIVSRKLDTSETRLKTLTSLSDDLNVDFDDKTTRM